MHNELVNISPHEPSDDCAEMAERDDGPSKMLARPGCADIALVSDDETTAAYEA